MVYFSQEQAFICLLWFLVLPRWFVYEVFDKKTEGRKKQDALCITNRYIIWICLRWLIKNKHIPQVMVLNADFPWYNPQKSHLIQIRDSCWKPRGANKKQQHARISRPAVQQGSNWRIFPVDWVLDYCQGLWCQFWVTKIHREWQFLTLGILAHRNWEW